MATSTGTNNDDLCEKHGTTDADADVIATAIKAAKILAATYTAYSAYDSAKVEWEIAKKYYNISKWWLDYYRDYFAPVEDQELSEAMNLEKEVADYETARGRARVSAWLAFKGKTLDIYKTTTRYMTGRRAYMLVALMAAQADAVAQVDGLGYRNERAYVKTRNDIRFQKMMSTAKRGRNMASDPISFTADALGSYGDLWKQAWLNLKKIGYSSGYNSARNETIYPDFFLSAGVGAVAPQATPTRGQSYVDPSTGVKVTPLEA
jgi:hypothetical protein